jgi:poly-beta-1,6-N-acetyl-D-glucosamine synthase
MIFFASLCIIVFVLYAIMVLLFTMGLIRLGTKREYSIKNNSHLPLSVIVALKNEQENIQALMESLANQNYPQNLFEIILVNDHSVDKTCEKATTLAQEYTNIKLLDLPNNCIGKKQAIDFGINHAKNNIIVLTDADCKHQSSWLASIATKFSNEKTDLLIGPVLIESNRSFFGMMQALEHASLSASTFGACGLGLPFMASSANLAFNRSSIDYHIQMLNPNHVSGDDVFLLHSAKKQGKRILCNWDTSAKVSTKPAKTLKDLILQRARWASKAPMYKDSFSIAIALTVLIFNAILLLLLGVSFINPFFWKIFAFGFGVKLLFDLPLLLIYLKKFNRTMLLKVFLPLQLLYPLYVVTASAFSVFGKVRWK